MRNITVNTRISIFNSIFDKQERAIMYGDVFQLGILVSNGHFGKAAQTTTPNPGARQSQMIRHLALNMSD